MKHILVVDDELGTRESLKATLSSHYHVTTVASAEEALTAIAQDATDLLLVDVIMPGMDGVALLKETQQKYPDLPVIMISASTRIRPAVEAIQAGALDYITKPFEVEDLRRIVARALERSAMRRQIEVLQGEVQREYPVENLIGTSQLFLQVVGTAKHVAKMDAAVLIRGESGTGKELVARLIHHTSGRRNEPFVSVHCAAVPEHLMEGELFGHEKGAFMGADRLKIGLFEMAGMGTLFFDEISEMTPATQIKLLRVIENREFSRIGGVQSIKAGARLIAATKKDLHAEVREGRFREDLYYRLNVVPLHLPPLRARREDIPLLALHYLGMFRRSLGATPSQLDAETMEILRSYPWSGNIRELRNVIERMVVLHSNRETLSHDCLPEEIVRGTMDDHAPPAEGTLEALVNDFERKLVVDALRRAGGVQVRAAELLGTTRRILRYRMERLNIRERDIAVPEHA